MMEAALYGAVGGKFGELGIGILVEGKTFNPEI